DGNGMANLYVAVSADIESHPDEKASLLLDQIEACARATIAKLMEDPEIKQLRQLGVLSNDRIKFWLSIDYTKAPPDNLARGIIAEALSARAQRRKHAGSRVISGLVVGVPDAARPDGFRKSAEIDNLTVIDGDNGLVPVELVEAKAGSQGRGRLITQLSAKIAALREVAAGKERIMMGSTDVTARFDLRAIDKILKTTATADEDADTPLSVETIGRLYEALVRLHAVGYESLRVLAI
ncbi:MAG TPA: hypothetical protein VFJ90_03560, partial [Candidatus Didemnitutus sp.]|nr:hypothetical protein [Candidatus Didemnitutus sp.]